MTIHPELIVSVSGIRGIVGTSLTPAVAMHFGMAYGSPLAGKTVLLSRDGRPSGDSLGSAVAADQERCVNKHCQQLALLDSRRIAGRRMNLCVEQIGPRVGIAQQGRHVDHARAFFILSDEARCAGRELRRVEPADLGQRVGRNVV